MVKKIFLILVIIASMVILRAFFMPWAKVKTSVVKASRELTTDAGGKLAKFPKIKEAMKELARVTDLVEALGDIEVETTVSGYNIPMLVNKKTSKVALPLMQVLFEDSKNLDMKSYLVYFLPVLGIVCIFLGIWGLRYKLSILFMMILSGAVSIIGLYNLKRAGLSAPAVTIVIEKGLWYTLYAFLFIFFVSILWLLTDKKR